MVGYKLFITRRHYIGNEENVEALMKGTENAAQTIDLVESKNLPIELRFDISFNGEKIRDLGLSEKVADAISEIKRNGIPYTADDDDKTTREKFVRALFGRDNDIKKVDTPLLILTDLDQYVLETEESLEQILYLSEKMIKDNGLYGIGSRNVPLVYAVNKLSANLRCIHELVNSLAMGGSERLAIEPNIPTPDGLTPSLRDIGESTTGFYLMNAGHPSYEALQKEVCKLNTPAAVWFAIEFFSVLRASELGNITSEYVYTNTNLFTSTLSEEEEYLKYENLIRETCRFLRKTSVGNMFRKTVDDENTVNILSGYYHVNEVLRAVSIMRSGLNQSE